MNLVGSLQKILEGEKPMSDEKMYKTGFVSGIFDLFHVGHLDLLKKAKSYCDYLIVTVATDEKTLQKKKHAPIIPYAERMEILRAIKYVDEVVEEINFDKIEAYQKYHFDVLFTGDDHEKDPSYIDTSRKLKKFGVDIMFLSRIGTSSTKLREMIEKKLLD
jgi:glycerol-3-phosphate cytidylyltransferase